MPPRSLWRSTSRSHDGRSREEALGPLTDSRLPGCYVICYSRVSA
jgi:hypothetical protein